jgi:hypothetical protein
VNNPAQRTSYQQPKSPSSPSRRQVPVPQKPNKRNPPTTGAPLPAPKRQQTTNLGQFRSARTLNEPSTADEIEEAEDDEEEPLRAFEPVVPAATLKLGAGRKRNTLLCSRPPKFRFPETSTEASRKRPEPRTRPKTVVDELYDR